MAFTEATTISLGSYAFSDTTNTENIDLCLGKNVLPAPDLDNKTWGNYTWKSINDAEICGISIEEKTITNLQIAPNPTAATSTLTLDLQTSGSLKITLNDLLGAELFELHNSFEDIGTFTKTFSLETLPKGVYFLKISHNGNVRMEKVVRN
jgi:hypothetical protein